MRLDLNRMTAAAIEAALDDGKQRRPRLSGMRAVAAGAALAVVARAAVKRAPALPGVADLAAVPDRVRDRLAEHGWLPDDEYVSDEAEGDEEEYDEEPYAEGDEVEDYDDEGDEGEDVDEEPAAEADDDEIDEDDDGDDDEVDEEPEAQADEDEDFDEDEDIDEEPEAEADGDEVEEPRRSRRARGRSAPRLDVAANGGDTGPETPGILDVLSAHRSRPPVMSRRRRPGGRVDPAARPPEPPERESAGEHSTQGRRKAKGSK